MGQLGMDDNGRRLRQSGLESPYAERENIAFLIRRAFASGDHAAAGELSRIFEGLLEEAMDDATGGARGGTSSAASERGDLSAPSCKVDDRWLAVLSIRAGLADWADLWFDKRVGLMYANDCAHGTESTLTVAAYIESGFNVARSAEALYLHRNSVAYRLRRIRELYGIDLIDDPKDTNVLKVLLSCKAALIGFAHSTET